MTDLPAGRELDAAIAEKVMGVYVCGPYCTDNHVRYSTDIAAAWEVVEKLRNDGRFLQLDSLGFDGEQWRCFFALTEIEEEKFPWVGEADTAPLAICRAALKAVSA